MSGKKTSAAPADQPAPVVSVHLEDEIGDLCGDGRAKLALLMWLGEAASNYNPGGSNTVQEKLVWRGLELIAEDVIRDIEDLGALAGVLGATERITGGER